jgi:hypothetical protein
MRRAWLPLVLVLVALAVAATGCAHQPPPVRVLNPPGFLSGLFHGFLMLFSLIGSVFTDVRVYAFPNNGFWYDLGFVIGASAFLGGGGGAASRRR